MEVACCYIVGSSSYLYLYLHSMVCRPVVCVANILLNYAWQWLELEMEMGTRTHARSRTRTRIRNQNLNAPQMQLNLKWLKSHKRGHLPFPCCPEILPHTHIVCVLFYVPDICNCYVYGIKFQKIFQTLTAFACDTLSDHCVFGPPALHPLPYPFIFFLPPVAYRITQKPGAEIITHFGLPLG